MKEITGNLFDLIAFSDADGICITTNGVVKKNSLAVMGKGCAGEAARRWQGIQKYLGKLLQSTGNIVHFIGVIDSFGNYFTPDSQITNSIKCRVFSFPTKDDWKENSKLELIVKSAKTMVKMADLFKLKGIILPRPGCSNGKLNWVDVKKEIEPILDDRFIIVSMPGEL